MTRFSLATAALVIGFGLPATADEISETLQSARDAYEVRGYRYPFVVKAAVACRLLRLREVCCRFVHAFLKPLHSLRRVPQRLLGFSRSPCFFFE